MPIENSFNVEIVMSVETELDIKYLTSNGMTLMILDPGIRDLLCRRQRRLNLPAPLPALEAPTAGTWIATVEKASTPPAEVGITIEW